jgi:hypothetical protein
MDCLPGGSLNVPARRYDMLRPRSPDHIEAQIVNSHELAQVVYALRHDSYVDQGFLDPRPDGLFSDEWDVRKNAYSVLVFLNGQPAASVRVSFLDRESSSADEHSTIAMESFTEEVDSLVHSFQTDGRMASAMEMSRLVRHPDHAQNNDLVFALFRMGFYFLVRFDADMVLSTVRRHHMPFYRRLGFNKIAEPKAYPRLKFQLGLMACFRPSYPLVQQTVPILDNITKFDSVYRPFMSGERVPVFAEMQ